jgi:hypothetical protein
MFDSIDRRRLYKEAREYMSLRTKRAEFIKDQKTLDKTAHALNGAEESAS